MMDLSNISIWLAAKQWLLALPLLAIWLSIELVAIKRHPQTRGHRGALLTRALIAALSLLALSLPTLSIKRPAHDLVFVVDCSASISPASLKDAAQRIQTLRKAAPSHAQQSLICFDLKPRLLIAPDQPWPDPLPLAHAKDTAQTLNTDIAAALDLAIGLVRPEASAELLLFTDARQTTGELTTRQQLAQTRHIAISTIPLLTERKEPIIQSVTLQRPEVRPGESVEINLALLGGERKFGGELFVEVEGKPALSKKVELKAHQALNIKLTHDLDAKVQPGPKTITVRFKDAQAKLKIKPQQARFVVQDAPRVLMVTSHPAEVEAMSKALEADGLKPQLITIPELIKSPPKLDKIDLVVLGNAPAKWPENSPHAGPVMPTAFIDALRDYVTRGGGLIVLGGDKSYGLGGYGHTKLLDILPVELDPQEIKTSRPATMLMVLDNSGSMGAYSGGMTKIRLAAEGSIAAASQLRPHMDYYGVMTVDTRPQWRVPLRDANVTPADMINVRRAHAAGGGIYIYTALTHAQMALSRATTPVRHVIIFADASDAAEQHQGVNYPSRKGGGRADSAVNLARRMAASGITTSVIGIGRSRDGHVPFLRQLAAAGRGRFHLTSSAQRLKSIFVDEAQNLVKKHLRETPFNITTAKTEHPLLKEIDWRSAPPLKGRVELKAKPTAETLWTDPEGKPVLTTWRYGLGQVIALGTDAGPRWSTAWLKWDGYAKFWSHAARWTIKRQEGDTLTAQINAIGQDALITVMQDLNAQAPLRATLAPLTKTPTSRPITLSQQEPGTWRAIEHLEPNTAYELTVYEQDTPKLTRTFTTQPPQELLHTSPDLATLVQLAKATQGQYDPLKLKPATQGQHQQSYPLWLYMLIAAVALIPIDAYQRRQLRVART